MLSDYDLLLFVRDTAPFVRDEDWLAEFGPMMVRWPLRPGPTFSEDWITQLVLFEDGVRIDFQVTSLPPPGGLNLDGGYRILVDKDELGRRLPVPSYAVDLITHPTAEAFEARLNAFWWDIIYVAKALKRGELNYAKYVLEGIRFEQLQPLLEWYIGLHHNWSISTGMYGRWFQRYLDCPTWQAYQQTFAGAEIDSNWQALFATLDLVRRIGRELAGSLDFSYPDTTDRKVTGYIRWIKDLDKWAGQSS